MYQVYALADAREPERVRYVGQTLLPLDVQLRAHLYDAASGEHGRLPNWVRAVLAEGRQVVIRELDASADEVTARWLALRTIATFRSKAFSLVNASPMGLRGGWHHTATARARIGAAARARARNVCSVATRTKIAQALSGQKKSPAARARMAAAHKGKPHSAERKAKLSAANKGRTRSLAARARMRVAQHGWRRAKALREGA